MEGGGDDLAAEEDWASVEALLREAVEREGIILCTVSREKLDSHGSRVGEGRKGKSALGKESGALQCGDERVSIGRLGSGIGGLDIESEKAKVCVCEGARERGNPTYSVGGDNHINSTLLYSERVDGDDLSVHSAIHESQLSLIRVLISAAVDSLERRRNR